MLMPFGVSAKIGLQPGFERPYKPAAQEVEPELTPENLLKKTQWAERRTRNQGFWAAMMNNRKADADFRSGHAERRKQRQAKRLECRTDIREANRGAMMPITINCFKAVLQTELEMLRKQRQHIVALPGPTEQYSNSAVFHNENLSKAITAIMKGIDSGLYENKEELREEKRKLSALYRRNIRLAMTQLRISRSLGWLNHLAIRLDDIRTKATVAEPVEAKISLTIDCLATAEQDLQALLLMDDNDALITAFRQEQSNVKFCIKSAREAAALNTELEQADAQNP